MLRNVLNTLRTPRRPTPRKVRLHVEGLEERACPSTIQQYAHALERKIVADSTRFVLDAGAVEERAPTALADTISSDLAQIFHDAQANQVMDVFHDFEQLGQDLEQEASYVRDHQLPCEDALENSLRSDCRLASDVSRLTHDRQRFIQLLVYVAVGEGGGSVFGGTPSEGGFPYRGRWQHIRADPAGDGDPAGLEHSGVDTPCHG